MSVLDEFQDGPSADPVPGLAPIGDRRFVALTPQDKVTLAQFSSSPAYAVLFKLIYGEVEKAETEHFRKWRSEEEFHRTGIFAVGMRVFAERLEAEIGRQVDEFSGELEFLRDKKKLNDTPLEDRIIQGFK